MFISHIRILKPSVKCNVAIFIAFIFTTFLLPSYSIAGQITLTWDPNVEPDVAGYSVYWGIESGIYPQSVDVGSQTDYTIYSLEEGQTYYFSVTAYNGAGTESDYASEVYVTLNTQMSSCAGDIDQDGIVDGQDMAAFSTAFASSIGELNYDPAADFDSDGAIAIPDLEVISVAFGRTDCN